MGELRRSVNSNSLRRRIGIFYRRATFPQPPGSCPANDAGLDLAGSTAYVQLLLPTHGVRHGNPQGSAAI